MSSPVAASAEESEASDGTDDTESPPEFVERARALFQMGVEHTDREEYDQAARRFEQALALHDAPAIRYNLASVYLSLERRADAAEQLDAVVASDDTPPALRTQAEETLSDLGEHLGRLTIRVDEPDETLEVSIDDRSLALDQLTRPLWVEPGSHLLRASRDGTEFHSQRIEVQAGGSDEVVLGQAQAGEPVVDHLLGPVDGGADEGEVERATPRRQRERRPLSRDGRIWVGVGVGLALVISAVVVGVVVGTRDPEVEPPVVGNFGPGVMEWR